MAKPKRYGKLIQRMIKNLASLNKQVAACTIPEQMVKLEARRDNLNDRLMRQIKYSEQIS